MSFVTNGTIELLGHVVMTSYKHYTSFFSWAIFLSNKKKSLFVIITS